MTATNIMNKAKGHLDLNDVVLMQTATGVYRIVKAILDNSTDYFHLNKILACLLS